MGSVGLLLGPVNHVINRIIHLDPDAGDRLAGLAGRRLRVQLTEPELALTAGFTDTGIELTAADPDDEPADITVTGRLGDLIAMAKDPDHGGGQVRFDGDAAVAQQARRFLRELDVDWEEALARHMGDIPAHQIGRGIRGLMDWLRTSSDAMGDGLAEYLTEEQRQLPSRPEVEAFLDDVDRLRTDTDRLQARIARLEQRRGGGWP